MTAPSSHFRQHHAVEAPRIDDESFRPAFRVLTRLDQLLIDRTITPHEWFVAVRLRTAVELVAMRHGVRSARTEFLPTGKPNTAPNTEASKHCRDVAEYFGSTCYGILTACVVDDLSWIELGRRLGTDPRTAKAWTVILIKMLGKKTA